MAWADYGLPIPASGANWEYGDGANWAPIFDTLDEVRQFQNALYTLVGRGVHTELVLTLPVCWNDSDFYRDLIKQCFFMIDEAIEWSAISNGTTITPGYANLRWIANPTAFYFNKVRTLLTACSTPLTLINAIEADYPSMFPATIYGCIDRELINTIWAMIDALRDHAVMIGICNDDTFLLSNWTSGFRVHKTANDNSTTSCDNARNDTSAEFIADPWLTEFTSNKYPRAAGVGYKSGSYWEWTTDRARQQYTISGLAFPGATEFASFVVPKKAASLSLVDGDIFFADLDGDGFESRKIALKTAEIPAAGAIVVAYADHTTSPVSLGVAPLVCPISDGYIGAGYYLECLIAMHIEIDEPA